MRLSICTIRLKDRLFHMAMLPTLREIPSKVATFGTIQHCCLMGLKTRDSRFVLIRIHCETDTELMTEPININNESGAFLLPCASFKHERRPCFVYELHGPELYDLTHFSGEDCNLPANWIHKVFKEALTALALLHKQGIVHGCM